MLYGVKLGFISRFIIQAALDDRNLDTDTKGLKATLKKRLLGAIDDGKTN